MCLLIHFQGGLAPTDNIRVYYRAAQKLVKIVEEFSEFIHSTVKQPLQPYPVPSGADVIITKQLPVSWTRSLVCSRTLVVVLRPSWVQVKMSSIEMFSFIFSAHPVRKGKVVHESFMGYNLLSISHH